LGGRWRHLFCRADRRGDSGPDQPKDGGKAGPSNFVYYKLAAAEYGGNGNSACNSSKGINIAANCIFNDITLGDIDMDCSNKVDCYKPSGIE
jgi:hypothetical protein